MRVANKFHSLDQRIQHFSFTKKSTNFWFRFWSDHFASFKPQHFFKYHSLYNLSCLSPDDPTAWRWWWWQPASTNGTPGPQASQCWGRGQKTWPGEEAEPQGFSWTIRLRLALQPRVPTESRLPTFQWNQIWGHEREVRVVENKTVTYHLLKSRCRVTQKVWWQSKQKSDSSLICSHSSEKFWLFYCFLLQSTVRLPSVHVSPNVTEPLLLTDLL